MRGRGRSIAEQRSRALSAGAPELVADGLLAQYDFVQGADSAVLYDLSGNDYHGTLGIGADYRPTWTGGGAAFASSLIDLPSIAGKLTLHIFYKSNPNSRYGYRGLCDQFFLDSSSDQVNFGGPNTFLTSGEPRRGINGPCALAVTVDDTVAANNKIYWGNRETVSYCAQGTVGLGSTTMRLGLYGGYYWNGTIYYALLYDRRLTLPEIQQNNAFVRAALATRGVSLELSTIEDVPAIVISGDSMSRGVTDFSWGYYLKTQYLIESTQICNVGVGGQSTGSLLTNDPVRVPPLFALTTDTPKIYILWIGTAALVQGETASQIIDAITARAEEAKEEGATHVVVCTICKLISGAAPVDYETKRGTINAAILGGIDNVDAVADIGGHPLLQDPTNGFYTDQIHLSDGGNLVAADLVYRALRECGLDPAGDPPTPPASGQIASDSFNRSDTTPPASIGVTNQYNGGSAVLTWVALNGNVFISSNRLYGNTGSSPYSQAVVDCSTEDVTVVATQYAQDVQGTGGIMLRVESKNSYFLCAVDYAAGKLRIWNVTASFRTLLDEVAVTCTAGNTYTIKARISGDDIKATVTDDVDEKSLTVSGGNDKLAYRHGFLGDTVWTSIDSAQFWTADSLAI